MASPHLLTRSALTMTVALTAAMLTGCGHSATTGGRGHLSRCGWAT